MGGDTNFKVSDPSEPTVYSLYRVYKKNGNPTLACHCALTWLLNVFLCHFEQNEASMSLLKIASRNRIFSPLRIEAKPIENLFPLGLRE